MRKYFVILIAILGVFVLAGAAYAQANSVTINPGESIVVECTTATCPSVTPFSSLDKTGFGGQLWNYNWSWFYNHATAVSGKMFVFAPTLWAQGCPIPPDPAAWSCMANSFNDMSEVANFGLTESSTQRLFGKFEAATSHGASIEILAYGPEPTNGVPPDEQSGVYELMRQYMLSVLNFATEHNVQFVYGPSSEQLSSYWDAGHDHTLDCQKISLLASELPDDVIWFVRPFQFAHEHPGDEYAVAEDVEELVTCIHNGNPELETIAQLVLSPFDAAIGFLELREALIDHDGVQLVDYIYSELAGSVPAGQVNPYASGTLAGFENVWYWTYTVYSSE